MRKKANRGDVCMSFDVETLARVIATNGPVIRVVITGFQGSSPRETGASMLIWKDGQSGTIGGGALEFEASHVARRCLETGIGQQMHLALGPGLGQCCGGSVDLLVEAYSAAQLPEIVQTGYVARPVKNGPVGQPPASVQRLIGRVREGHVIAPTSLQGWFVEPVDVAREPVWIYGAGHVGRALVAAFAGLPYALTWVDIDRTRFPETIPSNADMLVAKNPTNVVARAPVSARHYVLTYSHALDLEICHAVLSQKSALLGLIGSATKNARFRRRLKELGHDNAQIAHLTCPIGDPDLGKLPSAIALGVVHALLKTDRGAVRQQYKGGVA